ncbi:MAG: AMP-binding protein, partial [Gammaproteobacteria bacterium]|nr:AMP-binding protein [Gammaproteobacteria bacterium]
MSEADTVLALLAGGADAATAVAAPGREPLDYAGLRDHVGRTIGRLNELGIGRGDRVAIVLPNGPEMASAFVSVAAAATTAPLNPNYRRKEYDFYLEDLSAKALLVEAGSESDSVESARSLGITVLELHVPAGARAGEFELAADLDGPPVPVASPGAAGSGDIALVLHTSGTTSRPKIVPLLHSNLAASAGNIRRTLRLTPGDLCLNVMPLFHIHGLMAPVLASLSAGAAVSCTPGFNALRFFGWLDD